MKYVLLSALFSFVIGWGLTACAEDPVGPVIEIVEEEAVDDPWCSPHSQLLAGQWISQIQHKGHQYESHITIAEDGACSFIYIYSTFLDDPEHERVRTYESQGLILVTDTQQVGDLFTFTLESKLTYVTALAPDSTEVSNDTDKIYQTSKAKLWGTSLYMWQRDFERVGE